MKFTLKTKLLAFLFLTFSLIFGLSAWFSSSLLKEETSRGYEERYGKMVFSYALRVETILNAGTHLADQMAAVIARSGEMPEAEMLELLKGIIKLDTVLFAAGVAFEPYKYSAGKHHFGYFIYQSAGGYHTIDMGRDSTRYNYRDTSYKWYSRPLSTGKPYWSDPFYSSLLKGVKVVTYSVPIIRNGAGIGVVVVDYSLNEMNTFLVKSFESLSKRFLIIDRDGRYISHPDTARILNRTLATDENSIVSEETKLTLLDSLYRTASGSVKLENKTGERRIHAFYSSIPVNSWKVVLYEYEDQLFSAINSVFRIAAGIFLAGFVAVLLLVYFGTDRAIAPLREVRAFLAKIVRGDYKGDLVVKSNDEFSELATDLNLMQATLEAREEELKEINRDLENRVEQRTAELKETARLLATSNEELGIRNKMISDSINYAQKIQQAILPEAQQISDMLPQHFLIFRPKDVVSGDFYWMEQSGEKIFIVLADCTGHGVPGAFMSIIGKLLLNDIILRDGVTSPAEILTAMSNGVITELKKRENSGSLDGMDMAVCVYDRGAGTMKFAGAYRPLLIASNGEVEEIKAVSRSIGDLKREEKVFVEHEIRDLAGKTFYLFSDGITDQNDSENAKFGSRRLKELISEISGSDLAAQKNGIEEALAAHMRNEEQRDDISVLGFRLNI